MVQKARKSSLGIPEMLNGLRLFRGDASTSNAIPSTVSTGVSEQEKSTNVKAEEERKNGQ